MAAVSPRRPQLQKPSINKFIIALFLTKSKPANTSVRELPDHLSRLRTFIRRGSRINDDGSGSSHVDTVEFWKDSYHRSEAKQTELRVKISDLEQRLGQLSTPARAAPLQPSTQAKRKRSEGVTEGPSGRARKAAKTASKDLGTGTCVEDLDTIALGLNTSDDMEASKFLHDVHMLRRRSEQRGITAGELASHLMHICLDMRRMIAGVETPMSPSTLASYNGRKGTTRTQEQAIVHKQAAVQDLTENNLAAISRAFPILLSTLEKVSYMSEGSKVAGQMTHHLISVLRDLLDRLCLLCTTIGREEHAAAMRTKKPQARADKQIADYLAAPSASPDAEGRQSTKMLCQLGIAAMNALDLCRAANNNVLEGFLFFLLHRAGNLLRDFVFCDEDEQNINLFPTSGDSEAAAIRAAEAPYLFPLLKYAIILTAKRHVPATPTHARHGRIRSLRIQGSHSSHDGMTTKARIKLQNTLLRAVFGDNVTEIGESLQKPLDVSLEFYNMKQVKEGLRVGEWFKDEVWKTIGWDVLREVIAWK